MREYYWRAETKDGQFVSEIMDQWNDVKDNIKRLTLCICTEDEGFEISLPEGQEQYIQGKTASADFNGNVQVESRYIGFKLGSNIVRIRVKENTTDASIEID